MFKQYLSRAQTRAWSSELPIGDPTGGAAYGEKNDPVTASVGLLEGLGGAELAGVAGDAVAGDLLGSAAGGALAGGAADALAGAGAAGIAAGDAYMPGLLSGAAAAQPTNWLSYLTNPVAGAAISGGAGLLGAAQQSQAARDAAALQAQAGQTATQLQARMWQDQLSRSQPFYQAGVNALPAYVQGVMPGGELVRPFSESDFKTDPGYGFRVSEGLKALDRTAASRGGLLSGATLKGAQRFGQDVASQEYQNAYNRYVGNQATQRNALAGLTGFAPAAAATMGAAGTNYANTAGNIGMNTAANMANADLTGAAARQSAYLGAGNAFANALNPNPLNAYLNRQLGVA
jgi:hypothetical protein